MTIVNVIEENNNSKYLIVTQQKDPNTLITTRIIITDNSNNLIKLVDIQRGPQGNVGPVGPQGPPGQNATSFDLLPITSGGTNNTLFTTDKIIYYDGNKLSSTNYSINDLLTTNSSTITGIIVNSGLSKVTNGSTVTLNTNLGEGLSLDNYNNIIVDDSIARRVELTVGNISGILGISKGGTNSSFFNLNRLVYFDGTKLTSFPLDTGRIVTSGSTINVIAGSGLTGGGSLSIPSGSVVINIGDSQDILVTENSIELSNTGLAGTYTKVTTDAKGRVTSGNYITTQDILDILGYVPWHIGNDGENSGLDADLLDGYHGSYYLDLANSSGIIPSNAFPIISNPGTYSKITINNQGLVLNGSGIDYADVVDALGYRPVSTYGDSIQGDINIQGDLGVFNGRLVLEDNLPSFAYNNPSLLPNDPRGFSFVYGNTFKQTGILAYYPADDQLKLITDIFGTGNNDIGGGGSENDFNSEIDGGNSSSVFLLGNIQGDEAIVLLQHIADQRYVSLTANQIISGIKTFTNPVNVYNYLNIVQGTGYSGPPLFVGGNVLLNTNLNADLLDDNHGSYYRNASNLTGTLNYSTTTISNISGNVGYLSKFDNRTVGPSRTISDSIVQQSGASTIIVQGGSVLVGNNNTINDVTNSLAVGSNNSVSSTNSVAINYGSQANTSNSLAMGSYGTTWIPNQLSMGAFQELSSVDNYTRVGLGQHSVAAIGYNGTTNGAYQYLTPTINIPNNKTILYNIDLLFTKFGGSGAAAFSFTSGIAKNINGSTRIVQNHQKSELYNDSQIRDYIYAIKVGSSTTQNQILSVTNPPLRNNNLTIQNLPSILRIRPDLSEISGTFSKTFDGKILVQMHKPVSSGWYEQNEDQTTIRLKSYNHGAVTGSIVDIKYTSGIFIKPVNSGYVVKYVYNSNEFGVSDNSWLGYYDSGYIHIPNSSMSFIDNLNEFIFSGEISNNSNTINNCSPNIIGNLFSGMLLDTNNPGYYNSPTVINVSGNTVFLNMVYTGIYTPNNIFTSNKYSYHRFLNTNSIFIDDSSNYSSPVDVTESVSFTVSGIKIGTSGLVSQNITNPLHLFPTLNNSGNIICTHKRSSSGTYTRNGAIFETYQATYTQFPSISGSGNIDLKTNRLIESFANNYNPYIKFLTATNSFSGVLTSGSNFITNCNPVQSGKIISGMILTSSISGFPSNNIVAVSPLSDTIQMSLPFSGVNTTGIITYSGELPQNTNYFQNQILYNGSGISIQRLYPSSSGVYLTGQAIIYTDYGFADISVTLNNIYNIQDNEKIYLKFDSVSNGLIPENNNYFTSGTSINNFSIRTLHLMPDSGVSATGMVTSTLDTDHGYVSPIISTNLSQQIPLIFSSPSQYYVVGGGFAQPYYGTYPVNRTPKSGLFDILAVTGDALLINDNQNYLIKEYNSISFYDIPISTKYVVDSGNNTILLNFNKNYLQTHDQIFCTFSNVFNQNQNFRISNIDTNSGIYHARPVSGSVTGLPASGSVSYIGSTDGYVYSPTNNIAFHSYGGKSESWGRDSSGKYINPPITGFFSIYDSATSCKSGTLCVYISGISDFTAISSGQSFYFDFIDTSIVLTGIFNIYDKINNNIVTLNIPYNNTYINQSGLVYLINSKENIKTHKYPNYDNIFSTNAVSVINPSIYNHYQLSKYNDYNNRWKHLLSLKNTLPPNKYTENLIITRDSESTSQETRLIVFTPDRLSCEVKYSIDGINYNVITNEQISIPIGSDLRLKVITKNGAGYWSSNVNESAPRINLLGISNYEIFDNERVYNTIQNQWEIVIRCGSLNTVSNKTIQLTISDESERINKNFNLNIFQPLATTDIENVTYGYAGGGLYWRLIFEVYGGELSESQTPNIGLISQGYPEFATAYSTFDYLDYPSGWYGVIVQGTPGPNSGVFHPVVSINDGSSTIYRTGTLIIRPGEGPAKIYNISPRTLNTDVSIKYGNSVFSDYGFILPVDTNIDSNFNVVLTNTGSLVINNPIIEYRPNLKAYTYRANISGLPGYYNPIVNISVSQPSGITYIPYALSTGINLTIYNDLTIDASTELVQPLNFDINKDWSFDFYIKDGGVAHRENIPPKVYLSNTPNLGIYNTNDSSPLQYNIAYNYNLNNKYWKISVTGKKDLFGESAIATGNYPIRVYAEDYTSYITGVINTNVTGSPYLKNINNYKYATPNNGFEFNVDIGGTGLGVAPILSIPDNLKDSLINPTQTYHKYDPIVNVWEASYSCSPITEKWDANVSLLGSNLLVQAKGISLDKLYVAGRVTTVETENTLTLFKPLKIQGVKKEYEVTQGSSWSIDFSTEGGLEDSKYPPEIQFSNLPTPCTGYDPRLPDASNNSCFVSKEWNPGFKNWNFKFAGTPLCLSQGEFNIGISAIDRINDTTYGADSASTKVTYKALGDHPAPSISALQDKTLFPNCQYYQSGPLNYKTNPRLVCPVPTGITGVIMWGSLPPGLTVTDSRAGQYSPPYKDLTGGVITIQGQPTVFASGGQYPQVFNIAVIDARGKSGVIPNIIFNDGSSPIDASPTDMTLYFSTSGYQYTPLNGSGIVENSTQPMLRPPVSPFSMQCLSVLPHNRCLYSTGLYTIIDNNRIKLSGYGTSTSIDGNKLINSNQKIYIEFDNQINSLLNKEYIATRIDNDSIRITSSGHNIDPNISGVVKILKTEDNIKYLTVNNASYFGNPPMAVVDTTTTGILGGSEFKNLGGQNGFVGRVKPTLYSSLSSGVYRSNSLYLEDLNINTIPGENSNPYVIKFVNCYETGYLRISGMVIPSPSLDSSDPPPGGGNSYSYNNQGGIAVAIRTSYGSNDIEKNYPVNARSLGINYGIYNILQNTTLVSGSTSTAGNGIGTITFTPESLTSGTVYSLYLQHLSNYVFPTYNRFAIPSLNNVYYWIHKAGSLDSTPTQNSFPPVVLVEDKKIIGVSGINIDASLKLVGGYIPNNALSFPYGQWSYSNYPPHITGYMQDILPIKYSGSYFQAPFTSDIILKVNNHPFISGDTVGIKFNTYTNYARLPVSSTGVVLSSVSGNIILLKDAIANPSNNNKSGTIQIYDTFSISSGSNPYQIKIAHRSGVAGSFGINKNIDLIKIPSLDISALSNIFPNSYSINIVSGDNSFSYAAIGSFVFSGTLTQNSSIITNCTNNPLNILKTGVMLYSPTHNLPTNNYVTAIDSGSITLNTAYTGVTSNNVLVYYSGDNLSGYYSNLLDSNGTGICEIRENKYGLNNIPEISFSSGISISNNGQSQFAITGIPSRNIGNYIYRVITSENSGSPQITGSTQWTMKKYSKDYDFNIFKPITIVAPSATITLVNNSWTYSFAVTGGYIPRSYDMPEIEVNGYIHTFNRSQNNVSESGMMITLTSKAGLDWTDIFENPVSIKVYDETGYDLKYINAVY